VLLASIIRVVAQDDPTRMSWRAPMPLQMVQSVSKGSSSLEYFQYKALELDSRMKTPRSMNYQNEMKPS